MCCCVHNSSEVKKEELNARLHFSSQWTGKTQVLNETNKPLLKHVNVQWPHFSITAGQQERWPVVHESLSASRGRTLHTRSHEASSCLANKLLIKQNTKGDSAVTWLHRTRPDSPASCLLCCWAFSCDNVGSHGRGCKKHPQLPEK